MILTGFDPNVMFEAFFIEAFNAEGQPIGSFVNAPRTIVCGSAVSMADGFVRFAAGESRLAAGHVREQRKEAWLGLVEFI